MLGLFFCLLGKKSTGEFVLLKWQSIPRFIGKQTLERINMPQRHAFNFSEVIRTHLDSLYSAALRLTQNEMDAEDLLQTTCLKALQGFAQLRDTGRAKSWLFRILTNIFIDEYRGKSRQFETVELDTIDETYETWSQSEADSFLSQQFSDEVVAALDGLHPDIRLVVWYVDVEGFSYSEIAEMLSCPEGTVASRLFRGRNRLKKMLKEYVENQGILRGN